MLLHSTSPSNFLRNHGDAHAAAGRGGEQIEAKVEKSVEGVPEGNDGIAGKKTKRRNFGRRGEGMSDEYGRIQTVLFAKICTFGRQGHSRH